MFSSNLLNPNIGSSTQFYWSFYGVGGVNTTAANIQNVTAVVPTACTFDSMSVAHTGGAGFLYNYFLVKLVAGAPSNTALTCSLTTNGGTQTCTDTTHSVSAVAGEQYAFGAFTTGGTPTPVGRILVSVRCR
jgi:hypothetical protein